MQDDQDCNQYGLKCPECSAPIDVDSDNFSEHTGWFTCTECGFDNTDE